METPHEIIIIGSGLSGLSAAHFLTKFQPDIDVFLLEKEARPGGAIQTFEDQGFQAEWGPHGFLDNTPESRELLVDLGLDHETQRAPLGDFLRFVCHKGKLTPLPQSPQKLLTTPLLNMAQKIRLLGDLWIKPAPPPLTIAQWAAHRFGSGVLPLVDAAVTGTFAGDMDRLDIDAVMPGVRLLEIENGSVLRGLFKKKKNTPKQQGPLPAMLNFEVGMERLITALGEKRKIDFCTEVQELKKNNELWEVTTGKGQHLCRSLIIALPVNQALKLTAPLYPPPVKEIPTARLINVVLGFAAGAKVPRGFGYLAPEREGRFTMGAMFTSHMFPGRAPQGTVLLEALVGGRRHPERLLLDDQELIRRVCDDLEQLLELPEPPIYAKVLRPAHAIPQMEKDHRSLLSWRTALCKKQPGLFLTGFGWDGIGMNDMIKQAKKVAEGLISGGQTDKSGPAVKPVYF